MRKLTNWVSPSRPGQQMSLEAPPTSEGQGMKEVGSPAQHRATGGIAPGRLPLGLGSALPLLLTLCTDGSY